MAKLLFACYRLVFIKNIFCKDIFYSLICPSVGFLKYVIPSKNYTNISEWYEPDGHSYDKMEDFQNELCISHGAHRLIQYKDVISSV